MRTRRIVGIGMLVGLLTVVGPGFARADDDPAFDPEVVPAQFTQPVGLTQAPPGVAGVPTGATAPDPPTPVVRLHIHAPSHASPGKDVPYRITVTNASAAKAYQVKVRNPLTPGVATVVKAEPLPKNFDPKVPGPSPKVLEWHLGNLEAGESKTIELTLKPAPQATEIDNKAFVSFEHGQEVATKVDRPKLSVRKAAPKQAVSPDPITVRVEVANTGNVAVNDVKVVENISRGFEFTADGNAEAGVGDGQRIWKIGTLRAGERRLVEYKLSGNSGGVLVAQTVVNSPDFADERAESTTKVLVPRIDLRVDGKPTAQPGEAVQYEAIVTNTGTMPLSDVRLTAVIPADCTATRMTNDGQVARDRIVWTVPDRQSGPLKPGQSRSVRFSLKATTGGQRTVRVAAEAGRGLEESREVSTVFQATAVLNWRATLDRQTVPVGREALLTVRVHNSGGEPARNTRLSVELPAGVTADQASPQRFEGTTGLVNFHPVTVRAGGEETFTITFTSARPGSARFRLKLAADALGNEPLTKEQEVQITAGPGSR